MGRGVRVAEEAGVRGAEGAGENREGGVRRGTGDRLTIS